MATLNTTKINGNLSLNGKIDNDNLIINNSVWDYGVYHAYIPSHAFTFNGIQYYRIAQVSGCFDFDIKFGGSNLGYGSLTVCEVNICNQGGIVMITQKSGGFNGTNNNLIRVSQLDLGTENNIFDVCVSLYEDSDNTNAIWAQQDYWFSGIGNFNVIPVDEQQIFPTYKKHFSRKFVNMQKQYKVIGDESDTEPTGLIIYASDDTPRAFIGFLGNVDYTNTSTQLQLKTVFGDINLYPAGKARIYQPSLGIKDEIITEHWSGTLPNVTVNRAENSNYSDNNVYMNNEVSLGTGASDDVYINYRNGRYGPSSNNTGIKMYRFMNRNMDYTNIMTSGYHHARMDSDDYVLTAGGSYKNISDFYLKSELSFSYSDGVLSITKS